MIVLDTSVVLKWIFNDEAGSDRAIRLKDSHIAGYEIICVPDLLFYEIGNVLATKTRLSETSIVEAFSLLWNFSLERFDLGFEEFQGGLVLSRKYEITMYDAAYIELARRLKCNFVTADKKLYAKVKNIKSVELL
jgi:predicted nucleic acid-binding protein